MYWRVFQIAGCCAPPCAADADCCAEAEVPREFNSHAFADPCVVLMQVETMIIWNELQSHQSGSAAPPHPNCLQWLMSCAASDRRMRCAP